MSVSRKFLVAGLLLLSCLMLPNLSFASGTTDFSNIGGTLSGTNAGLSLTGSTLNAVIGFNGGGLVTGDLGTVSFSTGALSSGSLQMGGTFDSGGTFTIAGNGSGGLPNGVLFSGTFSGSVTWTLMTLANGTHNYTLTGVVTGTMGGASVNGVTVQLTINTGMGFFNGSTSISGGDTTIAGSVPEPSTLTIFGTGMFALAGAVRRKVFSAR
jgi:fibronectin-binding autotransporter adhesin